MAVEVDALIQKYFDLLYTCDVSAYDAVFHPNAQLHTVGADGYRCIGAAEYRNILASRKSPASAGARREDVVLSVDRSSESTALVKARALINNVRYCDYLSLLKIDGHWRIAAKVYCVVPD